MRIQCLLLRFFVGLLLLVNGPKAMSQKKLEKEKARILTEGLALYTLTLANWMSNDLYFENEFNTNIVSGYLSYRKDDTLRTIFWREIDTTSAEYKSRAFKSVGDTAQKEVKELDLIWIVKSMSFPRMKVDKGNVIISEEEERVPTEQEEILITYRRRAYEEVYKDTTFFKMYNGTKLKAVPFDAGKEVKVYIYASLNKDGIVPIGGDYLLIYDKKEDILISKEDLHKDCLFISGQYAGRQSDATKASVHEHKEGAAELITPTDISTLLLYKNMVEWDEHHVIGPNYTCIFTMVDRKLDIVKTEDYKLLKEIKSEKELENKNKNMR